MKSIRYNTFETNSSSTHSLTVSNDNNVKIMSILKTLTHIYNEDETNIISADAFKNIINAPSYLVECYMNRITMASLCLYILNHNKDFINQDDYSRLYKLILLTTKTYIADAEIHESDDTDNDYDYDYISNEFCGQLSSLLLAQYDTFITDMINNKGIMRIGDIWLIVNNDMSAEEIYDMAKEYMINIMNTNYAGIPQVGNAYVFTPIPLCLPDGDEQRYVIHEYASIVSKLHLLYNIIFVWVTKDNPEYKRILDVYIEFVKDNGDFIDVNIPAAFNHCTFNTFDVRFTEWKNVCQMSNDEIKNKMEEYLESNVIYVIDEPYNALAYKMDVTIF